MVFGACLCGPGHAVPGLAPSCLALDMVVRCFFLLSRAILLLHLLGHQPCLRPYRPQSPAGSMFKLTGRNRQRFSVLAAGTRTLGRTCRDQGGLGNGFVSHTDSLLSPDLARGVCRLFTLLGLLGVACWVRRRSVKPFLLAFGFTMARFFHGAIFVTIPAFLALVAARHVRSCWQSLCNMRLRILSVLVILVLFGTCSWYVGSDYSVPKLGNFSSLTDLDRLTQKCLAPAKV